MVAFLLFAVVAAVTPGPSNIMLAAAGARAGVLRGLPCLLGVASGMGAMMFVVPLGAGSLVLAHPLARAALHRGGAAVLLWLAWKVATSGGGIDPARARPVGFLGAAMFQWANPKSWLVTASAAGTFLGAPAESPVAQAASLGSLFVLAAVPSCLLWLAFGAGVTRVLRTERRRRTFNLVMGALLAVSVLGTVR